MTTKPYTRRDREVTLDDVFSALSNTPRRRVLSTLADRDPRNTAEFQSAELAIHDEEREAARVMLHHTHLPKLERAGFIDWDRGSDTITRGPNFEDIHPVIRLLHDHRDELPDEWP